LHSLPDATDDSLHVNLKPNSLNIQSMHQMIKEITLPAADIQNFGSSGNPIE
jgi:hypothetical protein